MEKVVDRSVPLGRIGTASYMTGAVLVIDGGALLS